VKGKKNMIKMISDLSNPDIAPIFKKVEMTFHLFDESSFSECFEAFKIFCAASGVLDMDKYFLIHSDYENCGELGPDDGVVDKIKSTLEKYPGFIKQEN
jgi:hypothetical protein